MGYRKLKVNIDDLRTGEQELQDAMDDLVTIQKNLQTAIDALKNDGGWDSNGADTYMKTYESNWIAGVDDRKAIMERMCENIRAAIAEYEQVECNAKNLQIPSY